MAKVATFAKRLSDSLIQGLSTAGIAATIDIEPIKGTKLHRVFVISNAFESLRPSERQDLVWRIVDKALAPDEQLQISMIFTLTSTELPK